MSSALTDVELLVALYWTWLTISPSEPKAPDRDRFVLSKGHGCASWYAVLAERGFIPKEWLFSYARENSPLPCHPCVHALPLIEVSSGSLGQGLGVATGILYGLRLRGSSARCAVIVGDGECNEGSVWESAMFAAAQGLDRLLAIVDYNGIQSVGRSDELMGNTDLEQKFRAFGWGTRSINGNSIPEICQALAEFPFEAGKPSAIIAKTSAGVSFMSDDVLWHYRKPSRDELSRALSELGERPIHLE